MISKSSVRVCADLLAIFLRWERVTSPRKSLNQVFIIFNCEKERSTEAVPPARVRPTCTRVLKVGHIFSNMELVDNIFNYAFKSPSVIVVYLWKVFHSVCRSEEIKGGICWKLSAVVLKEGFDAFHTIHTMICWWDFSSDQNCWKTTSWGLNPF